MKIALAEPSLPKTGAVVVGVFEGRKLTRSAGVPAQHIAAGLRFHRMTGKSPPRFARHAPTTRPAGPG